MGNLSLLETAIAECQFLFDRIVPSVRLRFPDKDLCQNASELLRVSQIFFQPQGGNDLLVPPFFAAACKRDCPEIEVVINPEPQTWVSPLAITWPETWGGSAGDTFFRW